MAFTRLCLGLLLMGGCVAFLGCQDSQGLMPVKGTLTINGQPADNVQITFVPNDTSKPAVGGMVEKGSFELVSPQGKRGCSVGKHKVVLSMAGGKADASTYQKGGGPPKPPPPTFNAKYLQASTSDKEMDVKPGSNNFTIDVAGP